ncbi:MAG: helix-turn-helix domain-containing protein [Nocardioides sp.]|nr:helix-turn-helix domain-containing protein [Nocardioides sp.]
MLVQELLDTAHLGLRLRYAAPGGLERSFSRVVTTDLLKPGDYLAGSELVLTEAAWRRTPADSEIFVGSIADRGVTTLITGTALFGPAPDDLVAACRRHAVTLVEVPPGIAFVDVTDHLATVEAAESGSRLSAGLVRQRDLLASMAAGRSLDEMASRIGREIGHECRVLTPTGRTVVEGASPLATEVIDAVVRQFLSAGVLPAVVTVDGTPYSVFGVGSGLGHRLTGWMVVVDGDHRDWPRESADAVGDLAAIVALDRTRREERLRAVRSIAADALALVSAGAPLPEVASRVRQAGVDPETSLVVVAADAGGHDADAATALLEDVVLTVGPALVAPDRDGRAVAVLSAVADLDARIRPGFERLATGLGRDQTVAVGLSSATHLSALAGALDEARFAARAAKAGGATVSVVGSEDVTSHLLLLAAVPDDVRRAYALRVLGSVVDHDERAGTALVDTLRTFLACSGSWTRAAEVLHLHVNTVRYRIERVQELTGRDLGRFDDRVDIYLALESL